MRLINQSDAASENSVPDDYSHMLGLFHASLAPLAFAEASLEGLVLF